MTNTQKHRIAMKALDKAIKRLKRMKKHSFLSPEYDRLEYDRLFKEYLYYKKIYALYDQACYMPSNQQNEV